ncbi:MAG: sugar ABC transporter permease [Actinomycetota bacterium]
MATSQAQEGTMAIAATADTAARGVDVRNRRSRNRRRTHGSSGLLFVLPFLLLFIAMLIVPLGYSLYTSVFETRLIGGRNFVGFDNYRAVLRDPVFRSGVLRVARFLVLQVPPMLGLALFFALALDSGKLRFAKVIRLLIFLPYAVPSVVAAVMWSYLYGPNYGPFAQMFRGAGLTAPVFLGSKLILLAIANIVSWEFIGYNMIIMFAALRAVPRELYEAAAVDGASEWRTAWSIKIPAIYPAIVLTLIFSVIGSFQLFNEPQILRQTVPNVVSLAYTPNLYAYNLAFTNQQLEYAAAVSFMLGFVILIVSYTTLYGVNRRGRRA